MNSNFAYRIQLVMVDQILTQAQTYNAYCKDMIWVFCLGMSTIQGNLEKSMGLKKKTEKEFGKVLRWNWEGPLKKLGKILISNLVSNFYDPLGGFLQCLAGFFIYLPPDSSMYLVFPRYQVHNKIFPVRSRLLRKFISVSTVWRWFAVRFRLP